MRRRIHWGRGRFCLCFLASVRLVRKVFWEGFDCCKEQKRWKLDGSSGMIEWLGRKITRYRTKHHARYHGRFSSKRARVRDHRFDNFRSILSASSSLTPVREAAKGVTEPTITTQLLSEHPRHRLPSNVSSNTPSQIVLLSIHSTIHCCWYKQQQQAAISSPWWKLLARTRCEKEKRFL